MAISATNYEMNVMGNKRVVTARLTSTGDAQTYATGLTSIDFAVLEPADETVVGLTYSGGIITAQTGGAVANMGFYAVGV